MASGQYKIRTGANVLPPSLPEVPRERESERRKRILTPYVADRLKHEEKKYGRGFVAHVARATDFTPSAISTAKEGNRNVGADLGPALATFWGFKSVDDLLRAAEAWAKANDINIAPASSSPELAKAVEFLRGGEISNEFVESWVLEHAEVGAGSYTRKDFLDMITAAWLQHQHGAGPTAGEGLDKARAARRRKAKS